jgi:hypothetical protein
MNLHVADLPRRHRTGGIEGWREWRLVRHTETGEYALGSLWGGALWEGPAFQADRLPDDRDARGDPGIYAWRPDHANPSQFGFPVRGRVLLHGRVVVHERGYRAEFALIQDLCIVCAPDEEHRTAVIGAALWYEPAETIMLSMQGYKEVIEGSHRYDVEAVGRSLERRYGCEVSCLEISREELEEIWASENP